MAQLIKGTFVSWMLAGLLSVSTYASQGHLTPWSWPTTAAHKEVAGVLREYRTADEPTLVRLQQELNRKAPLLRDALLDILVRARVPETTETDAPQVLSEPQRACVLRALKGCDTKALRQTLAAWSQDEQLHAGVALAALHVLAEIGDRNDLAALPRLVPRKALEVVDGEPVASPAQLTREGRAALRAACAGILARDPQGWPVLLKLVDRMDEPSARAVLEGVGTLQDPRALPLLARVARTQRALASHALAQVPKVGLGDDAELTSDFAAWIASALPFARGEQARLYAQALAALDEGAHVPELLECLRGDAAAQDAAQQALRQITGVDYGKDAEAWTAWMNEDRRWHEQRRPLLVEDLASHDLGRVVAALGEYAQHRTRRSELIAELAPMAYDERDIVRELVARTLRAYNHPQAQRLLQGLGL